MKGRHELTDDQWDLIKDLLPGKIGDPGRSGEDNRLFVNAIVWMARTGAPWRDLPERFGKWNSVFKRFRRWSLKGVWERLGEELGLADELESLMLDSTIVRVHQHGAGAKGGRKNKLSVAREAV